MSKASYATHFVTNCCRACASQGDAAGTDQMLTVEKRFEVAVFMDRDGTLAPDVKYCRRAEDLRLFHDAAAAIRLFNLHGLGVVVVTNQSGISRGYIDARTLEDIHQQMRNEIACAGGRIDALYYCPHHPDDGCSCRKPRPGMLQRASRELGVELSRCFLIGDQPSDVEAAHAAGTRAVLLDRSRARAAACGAAYATTARADYCAGDLLDAAGWILEVNRHVVAS